MSLDSRARAPRFGAHTSIAGGLYRALERGASCGCDVIQLFSKSSQQWAGKPITEEALERWRQARRQSGVEPVMVHDTYLINPASPDAVLWRRSVQALAEEYERCRMLDIPYLVMHPGAHLQHGEAAGIERVARAINRLHAAQPHNPTLLLVENTAGAGTTLGYRFEHLRDIFAAVAEESRLGVCLDTCHALAAGYDLRAAAGWQQTVEQLNRVLGYRQVRAFHINDSKGPLGSRRDRHAHLGQGEIGLEGLRCIVNDRRFAGLPMVIETPKASEESDVINLGVLRALWGRRRVGARARALAAHRHGTDSG